MTKDDYYVFVYDGVGWQQTDTIWQTFNDAQQAAIYLLNSRLYRRVSVALSQLGAFPILSWTRSLAESHDVNA